MKGLNNKILIIALLLLVAAFVFTRLFRSPGLESNLDDDLFRIDTARITTLKLYPEAEQRAEIKLERLGKDWSVSHDNKTVKAETFKIKDLLRTISQLKLERIISRKKEKWDDYEVGDTTAIQMVALNGADQLINFYVGKQQGVSTYARLEDEDEVYQVAGLLRSVVNKKFNDWRDKSFLRINPDSIIKITFTYPADSGFVAEKKDKVWLIDNVKADSSAMHGYLNRLRTKDLETFADDFKPSGDPDFTINIQREGGPAATIKGWRQSFYKWILSSSLQPDIFFSDEGPVEVKNLFPGKEALLKEEE